MPWNQFPFYFILRHLYPEITARAKGNRYRTEIAEMPDIEIDENAYLTERKVHYLSYLDNTYNLLRNEPLRNSDFYRFVHHSVFPIWVLLI